MTTPNSHSLVPSLVLDGVGTPDAYPCVYLWDAAERGRPVAFISFGQAELLHDQLGKLLERARAFMPPDDDEPEDAGR